uniref:Homeobox domain-containing protein n=1 Tax=Kalanchoe fedtschenkoi TaxID=63787 RepID=A0A7N0V4Y6_KALFE
MELGLSLGSTTANQSSNSNAIVSHSAAEEGDNIGSNRGEEGGQDFGCRKKMRLSKDLSAFLEESYKEHNTLNPKQKLALAKKLHLRPRQVEVWFQNRRARTKLKQTEVDCEYLRRRCETLTEENGRLQKELQDLRALKSSNPLLCLQSPATTLTMCPSCEATNATTTDTKSSKAVASFPVVTKSGPASCTFPRSNADPDASSSSR